MNTDAVPRSNKEKFNDLIAYVKTLMEKHKVPGLLYILVGKNKAVVDPQDQPVFKTEFQICILDVLQEFIRGIDHLNIIHRHGIDDMGKGKTVHNANLYLH